MGFAIKGTIRNIFETKQVSDRFTKREFTVETSDNPKYPQIVLFQITGDKVTQLDELQVGDEVNVEFNVRGREWRSPSGDVKYFTTLEAWRTERIGGAAPRASSGNGNSHDDQLPF